MSEYKDCKESDYIYLVALCGTGVISFKQIKVIYQINKYATIATFLSEWKTADTICVVVLSNCGS